MSTKEMKAKDEQVIDLSAMVCFEDDANMGMENADKESYAIPYLTMLQGLSPQIENVSGAKPGLMIETISNELFEEMLIVPCSYQRRFIRWTQERSYKGEFNPVDIETGKIESEILENGKRTMGGDDLSDTRQHYVLYKSSNGSWKPACFSLSSTQIKKSKRFMTRIKGVLINNSEGKPFNPPSFSHIYKVRKVKESNAKGEWWGYAIEMVEQVKTQELYKNAKAFYEQVSCGEIEMQQPVEDSQQRGF